MPALIQLAAAALTAGQHFNAPAPARQGRAPDHAMARQEICYELATGTAYPLDLRDCLEFAHSPDAAFKTQVCNFLKDTGQLVDFEFTSYAACLGHVEIR
ncbi:hypothetical protein [Sphingomonas sp. URHD0057]|uniref:hypothetical protein n=1 Tax=Sphingomonas sp. URHD0057 TaxID=1380389 RepID=UPI0012DC3ECE|nr:hypothetical protein [Sphingomonas sp. URHD0057]